MCVCTTRCDVLTSVSWSAWLECTSDVEVTSSTEMGLEFKGGFNKVLFGINVSFHHIYYSPQASVGNLEMAAVRECICPSVSVSTAVSR